MATLPQSLTKSIQLAKRLWIQGPRPRPEELSKLWTPRLVTKQFVRSAGTATTRHDADPKLYDRAFRQSIDHPDEFWAKEAENIVWHKKWNKVLEVDPSKPHFPKW